MGTKAKGAPRRAAKVPAACPSEKRSYTTRQLARVAARKAQQIRGVPFNVYRCTSVVGPNAAFIAPGCGQYHLTTRKDRTDGRRAG